MIRVTYIETDGTEKTVEARPGDSVMSAAVANGIHGIVAECGGAMSCATCHCYVDEAWFPRTGERSEAEADMLEFADAEMLETSRLSCQIKLSEELDGIIVRIPG